MKKRIIAKICTLNGYHVQSYGYSSYRRIGCPIISAQFSEKWGADEIMIVDIGSTKNKTEINYDIVKHITQTVNLPVCYVGGIKSFSQVSNLINIGVDKVGLNSLPRSNNGIIRKISEIFGAQALILCVDVIQHDKKYLVHDYISNNAFDITLEKYLENVNLDLFGEISISLPERDGTQRGLDQYLPTSLGDIQKPIILGSGFHTLRDLAFFLETNSLNGLAIGNLVAHQDASIWKIKTQFMIRKRSVMNMRQVSINYKWMNICVYELTRKISLQNIFICQ